MMLGNQIFVNEANSQEISVIKDKMEVLDLILNSMVNSFDSQVNVLGTRQTNLINSLNEILIKLKLNRVKIQ